MRVAVEIWPTSVLPPAGYRIALTVGGVDFDHGLGGSLFGAYPHPLLGSGPFIHDDPAGRPRRRLPAPPRCIWTGRLLDPAAARRASGGQ